jgi:predicted NBD/HSP70 family sugar kinase
MFPASTIEHVKSTNRQAILLHMRQQGLVSRTQLARATRLSKATISRILDDMQAEGLVEEVRTTKSGVGRPRILLRLATRARYAVGIELTATMARVTLTDMNAHPLKQRIQPLYDQDVDQTIIELATGVKAICRDLPSSQLVGVGVAVPGRVDVSKGIVSLEYPAGWQDIPLADRLSECIDLPVLVVNQAHAAAWGEKWIGAGHEVSDLLYLRLGTSVEAGLIINDRLHFGKTLAAGAIGHMTLDPQGALCTCGNHGCLNTIAGTPALLARVRGLLKEKQTSLLLGMVEGNPDMLTLEQIMQAVGAGDGLAVQTINEIGRALGVIVASLFNLLNLEKVIIGGPLSLAGSALLLPIQDEVSRRALPSSMVFGRIELTRLGADAASIGAASLLLKDPIHAFDP